jgi:hypothetical protein
MGTREFQGDHFEGDSDRERKVGKQSLVVCDLFKRLDDTYFMRVSLRSIRKPGIISRYEIDLDRYTNEKDFYKAIGIAAGGLAEKQCEEYGDPHDPSECVKAGIEAASELLHDIKT